MVSASFPYVAGMGASCCGNEARFDGLDPDYKRRLWLVIGINAVMFFVEMGAGALAGSRALQADALDFFKPHPDGSVGPESNNLPRAHCWRSPR